MISQYVHGSKILNYSRMLNVCEGICLVQTSQQWTTSWPLYFLWGTFGQLFLLICSYSLVRHEIKKILAFSYIKLCDVDINTEVMISALTHTWELFFICCSEIPADRGRGPDLPPHLAGDATQFEALIDHSLSFWVQFHTGATAQRSCREKSMRSTQWWNSITDADDVLLFSRGSKYKQTEKNVINATFSILLHAFSEESLHAFS